MRNGVPNYRFLHQVSWCKFPQVCYIAGGEDFFNFHEYFCEIVLYSEFLETAISTHVFSLCFCHILNRNIFSSHLCGMCLYPGAGQVLVPAVPGRGKWNSLPSLEEETRKGAGPISLLATPTNQAVVKRYRYPGEMAGVGLGKGEEETVSLRDTAHAHVLRDIEILVLRDVGIPIPVPRDA